MRRTAPMLLALSCAACGGATGAGAETPRGPGAAVTRAALVEHGGPGDVEYCPAESEARTTVTRDGRYVLERAVGTGAAARSRGVVRGRLAALVEARFAELDRLPAGGAPRPVPVERHDETSCADSHTFVLERGGADTDGAAAAELVSALAAAAHEDAQEALASADASHGTHGPPTVSSWDVSLLVVRDDGDSATIWFAANGRWVCGRYATGGSVVASGRAPGEVDALRTRMLDGTIAAVPGASELWAPLSIGRVLVTVTEQAGSHHLVSATDAERAVAQFSAAAAALDAACDLRVVMP